MKKILTLTALAAASLLIATKSNAQVYVRAHFGFPFRDPVFMLRRRRSTPHPLRYTRNPMTTRVLMSTLTVILVAMAWSMKTSSPDMPITTFRPGTVTIGIIGTITITARFLNGDMPVILTAGDLTVPVS